MTGIGIIRSKINDNNIRLLMLTKVPHRRIITINNLRAIARIRDAQILIGHPVEVAPAVLIVQADTRVGGDVKLGVAHPLCQTPGV